MKDLILTKTDRIAIENRDSVYINNKDAKFYCEEDFESRGILQACRSNGK